MGFILLISCCGVLCFILGREFRDIVDVVYCKIDTKNDDVFDCDDELMGYICRFSSDGDLSAYQNYLNKSEIVIHHYQIERTGCSMFMSNVHNNIFATFDVYDCMRQWSETGGLDSLDASTRQVALYYLEKSAYLGYEKGLHDLDSLKQLRPFYFKDRTLQYEPQKSNYFEH